MRMRYFLFKQLFISVCICCAIIFFSQISESKEGLSGKINCGLSYSRINEDSLFNKDNTLDLPAITQTVELSSEFYKKLAEDSISLYFSSYGWCSPQERESIWKANELIESDYAFFQINEVYLDYQASEELYFLIGQQKESWGNGMFWTPANIVDPQILYDKPVEAQMGRPMFKCEYSFIGGSYSFFLIPLSINSKDIFPKGLESAFKINALISNIDLNLGIVQTLWKSDKVNEKTDIAFWASYAFPFNLTLSAETSASFHNKFCYPDNEELDENENRQGQAYLSLLLSANYIPPYRNIIIRGEYFYNGAGYTNTEREDYFNGLEKTYVTNNTVSLNKWIDVYEAYSLSQNYLGLSIIYLDPLQVLDNQVQIVYGINDGSMTLYNDLKYHFSEKIDIFVQALFNTGRDSFSEFRQQMVDFKLVCGTSIYF